MNRRKLVQEFSGQIGLANLERTKKERFITLLKDLFSNNAEARQAINEFTLGAERTIFRIPLKDRLKTGFADTQYRKIIIEFEADLNKTGEHAKEQLKEYIAGLWQEKEQVQFTLIASDFLTWKVYAPKYEHEPGHSFIADDIELVERDSFELLATNADDFYFFLDRYLFKTTPQKPTLERIKNDFGETSDTFLNAVKRLTNYFNEAKNDGNIKVAFNQWEKFLSIAYGKFEAAEEIFIVHTYLSIFAKFLAYEVITQDDFIDEDELKGIITGHIFERQNVQNFIDKDFYNWIAYDAHFPHLKKVFRIIAQKIGEYDFSNVEEDILKGIYQELIDLETRHALGEYYTPDWLCGRIMDELKPEKEANILDPACGSGSFLRAGIDYLKTNYPDKTATELVRQVVGIDIHPLSVQIAKTTVLLALGRRLREKRPIYLRVYLANTLLIPERIGFMEEEFRISVNDETFYLPTSMFDDQVLFDQALNVAEELAIHSPDEKSRETFSNTLQKRCGRRAGETHLDGFFRIYKAIKKAIEDGRDGIWRFIIQNTYKPFLLSGQFDYVIGNPPWLTYSDISVASYQDDLKAMAEQYEVMPERAANFPHLEIAAIFLAHCSSFFLKEGGSIAFVLPRSFFSADHHTNTRPGTAHGTKITQLWDLENVSPLFRVPSCVIFGRKAKDNENRKPSTRGIRGCTVRGKLPNANASRKEAQNLNFNRSRWYHARLGKLDAFSPYKIDVNKAQNPYHKKFKQSATIVPRNCYFIELAQQKTDDFDDRILVVKTSEQSIKYAKKPWKQVQLEGKIHTDFLFHSALSKNILPYAFVNLPLITLPIEISNEGKPALLHWEKMMQAGYLDTANWFKKVERYWEKLKTDRNKDVSYLEYLNWQNKIVNQRSDRKFHLLYTASGKNANAVVVDSEKLDLPFIADAKSYLLQSNNENELYYVCTFLNSDFSNKLIKSFQSRGLFGARDIHKKILEVPFPKFDRKDSNHLELADLGKKCHKKAQAFAEKEDYGSLSPYHLGRARLAIKEHLKDEMKQIDALIKKLVEGM